MNTATAEAGRSLTLQRLFQLASPSLPVGAFAYSEGLETAVARDRIRGVDDARDWIDGTLTYGIARLDLPLMFRLHAAWRETPADAIAWSGYLMACRETAERRAQERHLGNALAALLCGLEVKAAAPWRIGGAHASIATFAGLFALAAVHWSIDAEDAAAALAWSWLENQVLAAVKLVPLGQTDGQRLLLALAERVPPLVAVARELADDDLGGGLPGAAFMSAAHETLYSRLYRS